LYEKRRSRLEVLSQKLEEKRRSRSGNSQKSCNTQVSHSERLSDRCHELLEERIELKERMEVLSQKLEDIRQEKSNLSNSNTQYSQS
jgi:hypothetical protein